MKPSRHQILPLAAAIAALCSVTLPGAALAQTTATTTPVGFITLNIAGNGGGSSPALSLAGLGLVQPTLFQGVADSMGTNTIGDSAASWIKDQFNGTGNACFVEILSGTDAGVILDIASTAAAVTTTPTAPPTITTVQPIPHPGTGISFAIRQHWTIGTVFGATNSAGLFQGPVNTADQILLYNGSSYDTYYYSSGFNGVGWRKNGAGTTDESGTVIYPDQGFLVVRNQSAPISLVLMGAVKTGQTSIPIQVGLNVVGNVYAASMTLNDSGLYSTNGDPTTGVLAGPANTADQVLLYNGTGYDTYYYSTGFNGTGWRKNGSGSTDFGTTVIPVGSAVLIQRQNSALSNNSGFNWVVPQHPTSF